MNNRAQLDLFSGTELQLEAAEMRLLLIEERLQNLRKGLFQRYSNIEKMCIGMQQNVERLETLMLKEVK